MGVCLTKQAAAKEDFPTAPTVEKHTPSLVVSLEKVKALSSNALATAARYHTSERHLTEDYEIFPKKVLGEGCNGLVVLAKGRHDGRHYALKRIQKSKVNPKALKQLFAEVEIYLTLDHPHIATLRDVYETDTAISLLTEYCEGGELYSRLSNAGTYTESDAAQATRQMLLAVAYLHAHNVVHRDLKLENFLYETKQANSALKLIDFGFAKVWDPSTLMMASCGSIAYVSPDVLAGTGYTSKCDLWSLGVITFMLLVGYPPFHGSEKEIRANIVAGKVDYSHRSRWKHVSDDAVHFVEQLLMKDETKRFDAQAALKHRWLTATRTTTSPVLDKQALRSIKRFAEASKLRRAVVTLLAQELAPEETRELRELFLSMDRDGKGTISLAELKDAIRGNRDSKDKANQASGVSHMDSAGTGTSGAVSPKTPAAKLRRAKSDVISHLFEVLDANGDEQVYYSDFLAATLDTRSQLRQETVRAAFHRLDADKSGTISAADLKSVIGETFEGVNVELLVQEADLEGDIDFGCFLRMMEECDATPKAPPPMKPTPSDLLGMVP